MTAVGRHASMSAMVSATVSQLSPSPPKTRLWQKGKLRARQMSDAARMSSTLKLLRKPRSVWFEPASVPKSID